MAFYDDYLAGIDNLEHRQKFAQVLKWVEAKIITVFEKEIQQAGLSYGKKLVRVGFDQEVPYELLAKVIEFNLNDKKDCQTFWRK